VPSTDALAQQARAGWLFAPPAGGALSFVHIDDAVAAIIAALDHAQPGLLYNIADDQPRSMREFLSLTAAAVGGRPPRSAPRWLLCLAAPVVAEFVSWRIPLSNAKARSELGWLPKYPSVRDGLRRVPVA
jgi:nucleoside-diphosphate-sugar epimerase